MRLFFVTIAISLLIGIEGAGRGRMKYRGRQLPFPGQPDEIEEPWPPVSVEKVDRRKDSWQDDTRVSAVEDLDDTVVVGDIDMPVPESPNESRQFYPGWAQSVDEIPRPVTPVTYPTEQAPTQESSYNFPQQTTDGPQQLPSQQPAYPLPQQPTYPTQQPSYPPEQPSYPPQQPFNPPQQPSNQPQQPQQPQQPSNQPQQPQQPPKRPQRPMYQRPPRPSPTSPPGCLGARGQYPSLNNCANYLNCWDEIVIEQTCPNGLLFNDVTGLCDFEVNVDCGSRPGATPKPALPPGSKRCPDVNGHYRSSTNCSEFYICLAGSPIKFNCPRGLVYNDVVNVCDYTYNVDCQGAATPKPLPLPRPESPKPAVFVPQRPTQPPPAQQTPRPPPTFPPSAYPENPWRSEVVENDLSHQRSIASKLEVEARQEILADNPVAESIESEPTESPTIQSPWDMMHSIPEELAKVPCENGSVHRLDDVCSSVIVCRNKRPELVQCSSGLTYDRPTDSCRHSNIAKC